MASIVNYTTQRFIKNKASQVWTRWQYLGTRMLLCNIINMNQPTYRMDNVGTIRFRNQQKAVLYTVYHGSKNGVPICNYVKQKEMLLYMHKNSPAKP